MAFQKSIGTTVGASVGEPTTFDAAGYAAVLTSPSIVGRIIEPITLSSEKAAELVNYLDGSNEVIQSNETFQSIDIVVHNDSEGSAGHDLLEAAYTSGANVSLEFTLPDTSKRYTCGTVTKKAEVLQISKNAVQATYSFMPKVAALKVGAA